VIAVTFDYGQTLAEIDLALLATRVGERGARCSVTAAEQALPDAWRAYTNAKREGAVGEQAWRTFMERLLHDAIEVDSDSRSHVLQALSGWLWLEQPRRNLWRKPIPGMLHVVEWLVGAGVPVGIVSNSEGRLKELLEELGWSHLFAAVADSGLLGFEKPDRRIFDHAAAQLGVASASLVHVGDVWDADVVGALKVGARAIWFTTEAFSDQPRVAACADAAGLRTRLREWDVA
jgi:putative hydrolase of the HAD superfamily